MPDSETQAKVTESYGRLPLRYEANEGQFDSRVEFVSRGGGHTVYHLAERDAAGSSVLRMKLIGAARDREVDGHDELAGSSNYFIGDDPTKWRTGVKGYSKVGYRSAYPGIDVVYHCDQRQLEYDVKVAPGANPGTIRLAFEGAKRVRIDKSGDLVLATSTGQVRQHKPFAYQDVRGSRKQIAARYVSPTFGSFGSSGGSGSVNVLANEGCVWSAASDTSWITITSNDNGIGAGVVLYSVGANAGAGARKGKITIAGQTFPIKQKGNLANGGSGGGKP